MGLPSVPQLNIRLTDKQLTMDETKQILQQYLNILEQKTICVFGTQSA